MMKIVCIALALVLAISIDAAPGCGSRSDDCSGSNEMRGRVFRTNYLRARGRPNIDGATGNLDSDSNQNTNINVNDNGLNVGSDEAVLTRRFITSTRRPGGGDRNPNDRQFGTTTRATQPRRPPGRARRAMYPGKLLDLHLRMNRLFMPINIGAHFVKATKYLSLGLSDLTSGVRDMRRLKYHLKHLNLDEKVLLIRWVWVKRRPHVVVGLANKTGVNVKKVKGKKVLFIELNNEGISAWHLGSPYYTKSKSPKTVRPKVQLPKKKFLFRYQNPTKKPKYIRRVAYDHTSEYLDNTVNENKNMNVNTIGARRAMPGSVEIDEEDNYNQNVNVNNNVLNVHKGSLRNRG